MRVLRKNTQKLKYANITGDVPIYTEYTEVDGTVIKLETGDYEIGYSEPISFLGNIAMSSSGEAEPQEFGLSLADYNAVIVMPKDAIPITEGSLIWHKSDVGYKYSDETQTDPKTADYEVIKVSESLNGVKYVLKAIVK